MSAPSSVCSDDSFEIVNNEVDIEESKDDVFSLYKPKVTFHEVFDVYPMDADIVAKVTFDHDYLKSDEDTVVVLPIAWKSVDQALCAANINGSYVRFDVKDLPKIGAEDKFYQLCYCTGEKIVMGVSIPFSFRDVHEDELVEFQKEQNKEFWTFRSRFAVLTDNYWNSLMEKQANADKLASNSVPESASPIDGDQKAPKETETTSELLRTSDHFSALTPEKETPNKSSSDEIGAGEPRENTSDSDKITENVPARDKILLFTIMEAENEAIKQENQKLKAMVFEIIRAMSINDRETCRRTLSNAINGNGEVFTEAEFSELCELFRKSLIEPDVVKSSEKKIIFEVTDDGELDEEDEVVLIKHERDHETAAELAADRAAAIANESYERSATAAVAAANSYTNEKILLFKIMENENAELKEQYEKEQLEHTEAKNIVKNLKDVLIEIMNSTALEDEIRQKIESSLPSISAAFNTEELDQVRELLKKEIAKLSDEIPEDLLKKVDAAFVVTSDGNILFADQWEKQIADQAPVPPPADDYVVELEAKFASSVVEKEKLATEVKTLQATIKDLNEQLINQRQSEVEKMITVTNNMRDQYMKNMSKLTDSNKVLGDKLTDKDKEIETLNRNLLDASKLLTDNEREIRDLKARDHTFVGFLERRNLKRISELRETLQEMYSKRWAERQESAKLKEDLLTTQTMLNSLCDELEKSTLSKSPVKMENSAQTGEKVENSAQTSNDASSGPFEAESLEARMQRMATEFSKAKSSSSAAPPAASAPQVSTPELETTTLAFRRIKQREQALAAKLVEMTAELEKMRTTQDKTKTDLESRLKDGAKQYAKLYVKYDKLLNRSQTTSRESSAN